MIKLIIIYMPVSIRQNIKRAIEYWRSNGSINTIKKIAIKLRQHPYFRFQASDRINDVYSYMRSNIDDRHPEYKCYTDYSSCDQVIKYIAFYLPQFHPIPENNLWWGDGFTEWSNVTRALPQYNGHYQPRLPGELGFYDLRLKEVRSRQIKLAQNYGIYGFCFHYYWFSGKKLLDYPINALLNDKALDFPFCINWANENWTRRWDGKESDILLGQTYSDADHLEFIKDVSVFLQDQRYIRVQGRPLLLVYRPSLIPNVESMVKVWREYCRDIGLGEIYLVLTHSFDTTDPGTIGFDAAVEFSPNNMPLKALSHKVKFINNNYSGNIYDYESAIELAKEYTSPSYTKFRCVCPSWDNEARKTGKGTVLDGAKPSLYKEWLDVVNKETIQNKDVDARLVFINAWNEWAEGAYLEPDKKFGYAYLEETRNALENAVRNLIGRRIVLVSHDAHPHGAQYLLLHIVKYLHEYLKFIVDVIFLNGGELLSEFSLYSNTHCVDASVYNGEAQSLLLRLYKNGARTVILNTVVSGSISDAAKAANYRIVSLVHEMPELIIKSGHIDAAKRLGENSDLLVFPAAVVKHGIEEVIGKEVNNSVIQPQGLFRKNKVSAGEPFSKSHLKLCNKLKISEESKIVLNVGYGDYRKGIDLFVDIAASVHQHMNNVYFVWVGHLDINCESKARKKIKKLNLSNNVIFTGKDFDTDLYYAGSDVFALTSREDPFPSVVLEAIDSGCPVIGFDGAGGFTDIISKDVGVLVNKFDTKEYAKEIITILSDDEISNKYAINSRRLIDDEYSFPDYIFKLLDYAEYGIKKVSVIIPNYNYKKYILERIQSILNQNYPIYELIVLDDCSDDGSVEVIQAQLEKSNINYHLIVNNKNSGSVFEQWHKGVMLAKGDYVWIAEADDLSDRAFVSEMLVPFDDADVVLSYCESFKINTDGDVIGSDYQDYVADISSTKWNSSYINDGIDEITTVLGIKNTIPNVSSIIFKREKLLSVLNENIQQIKRYKVAGDWVTYLHVLSMGKIAFNFKQLNYHRRHVSSVTLKKFDIKLLAEIISVQELVRNKYSPAESDVKKSERYAQELYEQFGIKSAKYPYVYENPELKRLIRQ